MDQLANSIFANVKVANNLKRMSDFCDWRIF
jgi:hypothetical protein